METLFQLAMPDIFCSFFASHKLLHALFNFVIVSLFAFVLTYIARIIVDVVIKFTVERTRLKWDDIFFRHGVFSKFVNMVPALVFYWSSHNAIMTA